MLDRRVRPSELFLKPEELYEIGPRKGCGIVGIYLLHQFLAPLASLVLGALMFVLFYPYRWMIQPQYFQIAIFSIFGTAACMLGALVARRFPKQSYYSLWVWFAPVAVVLFLLLISLRSRHGFWPMFRAVIWPADISNTEVIVWGIYGLPLWQSVFYSGSVYLVRLLYNRPERRRSSSSSLSRF
jgi:hypothetical protein